MSTGRLTRLGSAVALAVMASMGAYTVPAQAAPNPIVGGDESPKNAYSWMVQISRPGVADHWCGGSLVTSTWVLTAAHCTASVKPADFRTLIGQTQISGGSGGDVRNVAEIRTHPRWNSTTRENDIALLRLSSPSTKTPIQNVTPTERSLWAAGVTARTMGWGDTTEGGDLSNTLRQVDIPIQADSVMSAPNAYGSEFKATSMLGAGPMSGGKDSCQGDSGGPLATSTAAGWRLVGVVSWGYGCARANYPGIYARIGEEVLYNFIRSTVSGG